MADISEKDPRVYFAAERTLLAWVRTGLAMMGFGFVVARFGLFLREFATVAGEPQRPSLNFSLWIGAGLILLGVFVNLISSVHHLHFIAQIKSGKPYTISASKLGIAVTLLLATIGVIMTMYLIFSSL